LKSSATQRTIYICHGTGCVSSKAEKVRYALEQESKKAELKDVKVDFSGCHGFCQQGPIVNVEPEGIFYGHVTVDDVPDIVESHLIKGTPVERLFYRDPVTGQPIAHYKDITFYKKQQRVILRNCGHINPEIIEDYIAVDGYKALRKVISQMTPEQVIAEIKRSGLRGRGGAGFPTGTKWEFCRNAAGNQKFLICNADEGDPGAFMDRSILEADPHAVIEGMLIAAYAIGASEGYIYVRAEYPLAIKRLVVALQQAEERGFLGENILNSGFSLKLHIKEGAGAFVCGEETALMASIEGRRGMPNSRPPFPAQSGLWGKPSNINNVKSFASTTAIMLRGADWYSTIGTKDSRGTVVFALTGNIANAGLVEVPMGTALREIVYEIGGGIPRGKRLKAVQTGGPSGGCLPASMLDMSVEYETLAKSGSILGSGGMVVMDEDTCIVDIARYFLSFTQSESCGKCVPCRLGTKQMLGILEDICAGRGKMEDLDLLQNLAEDVKVGALCALGGTAPNPVLTTLRYFRDEYVEHIKKHHCRATVCKGLVKAPCSHTCPAGIDVSRYVRFIGQGRFADAVAVIREKVPFPMVLGHVCIHPCESKCRRGQVDDPIAIRTLKRFAAEQDDGRWKKAGKKARPTGKRVAIVGSGPAGLTAAYYLAKLGHKVTVFEALPQVGGMMRVGIPEYRLPSKVLDAEIGEIEKMGAAIKTNSRIESIDELFKQGNHAVFVAIGAHQDLKMGVPGEDGPGVIDCASFLRDVKLGKRVEVGSKVAVIGGGNAAIDASRTALRLGAKHVIIIYRRTRAEMPAAPEEVEDALHEGIEIVFLAAPNKVSRKSGKVVLECLRMELGKIDASGRPRPEPIVGSEFPLDFDTVIAAIGQRPDVPSSFNLVTGRGNTIQVDPDTLATDREGVFAGGDAITGPASVIEAIAAGRQVAVSIDKYLGGSGVIDEVLAPAEEAMAPHVVEEEGEKHRQSMPCLSVGKRVKNFDLVELSMPEAMALEEAKRCLNCDLEE
jgi:NADH-quinone oxidoreductase subunit F